MTGRERTRWPVAWVCLLAGFLVGVFAHDSLRDALRYIKVSMLPVNQAHPDYIYSDRINSIFHALQTNRPVVLFGDSRIEEGRWSELFQTDQISNRGISGDTVSGLHARLSSAMPGQVTTCLLQVGFNDLYQGMLPNDVADSYKKLALKIQSTLQANVVLTSTILGGREYMKVNERIADLNEEMERYAVENNIAWVDVNEGLCPEGYLDPQFTNDGIHLNGHAYVSVMKPAWIDVLGLNHESE